MNKRWLIGAVVALVLFIGFSARYFVEQGTFNGLLGSIQTEERAAAQNKLVEATNDVFGGSSPEETLQLYTKAIESEDYALASKYFILEKIDKEFNNFLGADRYAREAYLKMLRQLQSGTYSEDGTLYTMRAHLDGPDFFARFRKYPHNLWKIIEI